MKILEIIRKYPMLLVFAILILVVMLFNDNIRALDFYQNFFNLYTDWVGKTTVLLIRLFHPDAVFESGSLITHGTYSYMLHSNFALRYHVFIFLILFLLPGNLKKSILYFLLSVLLLFVISVLKCFTEVLSPNELGLALAELITTNRNLLLILALSYKIKINSFLLQVYLKVEEFLKEKLVLSLFTFVVILIYVTPLSSVIEELSYSSLESWFDAFTDLLLFISGAFLELLNYQPRIVDKMIYIDNYWVYLGRPCLGIGLMITFLFIIMNIKSKLENRVVFILIGYIIIIVMNAVRIAFVLLHLVKHGDYKLTLTVHDLSDYFFYVVVFVMILSYLNWFQYLKIFPSKKEIKQTTDINN